MYRLSVLCALALVISCSQTENENQADSKEKELVGGPLEMFPSATTFSDDWSRENTMVYHVLGEPDNMHPTNGGSALKSFIFTLTQAHLLEPDSKSPSGLKPGLVQSMPVVSGDGLAYTYKLRSEPKWDNGTAITVGDVIFSLMAAKCPLTNNPHLKPYLENLKSIKIDSSNELSFTIIMKERNVLNMAFLTGFPLMQEAYWDSAMTLRKYTFQQFDDEKFNPDFEPKLQLWATEFNSAKYSRNPEYLVGIGPYRFHDWKPGQSFKLIRKTAHWTFQKPSEVGPDEIIFKINADPNSHMLEFKTQVYDGSQYLASKDLYTLQNNEAFSNNYNSAVIPSYNYTYLGLNCRPDGIKHQKLFNDPLVRRAIAHAIPYDAINEIVNFGSAKRVAGPVSPLKEECNSELLPIDFNLDNAAEILGKSGWIDTDGDNIRDKMIDDIRVPFKFDLHYLNAPASWTTQASLIAESLKEIGVECNPVAMSFAVLRQRNKLHDFDAMLSAWAGSSLPEDYAQIWGTESWANQGSNYVGFGNPAADQLIDSIKFEVNIEKRNALSFQLQELIYKEQPYVFLFASTKRIVAHKRFSNVTVSSEPPHVFLHDWRLGSNVLIKDEQVP